MPPLPATCPEPEGAPARVRVLLPLPLPGPYDYGVPPDLAVQPGDLLAVLSAGAYCMSMASNYNSRGRATEVLVHGNQSHVIRRRESIADQIRSESLL